MKFLSLKTENAGNPMRFGLIFTLLFTVFALSASAQSSQSTDPFKPTSMTSQTVRGMWTTGNPSYFYSFVAGPGPIKVSFSAKPNASADYVGGELRTAEGRLLVPVENQRTNSPQVAGAVGSEGKLFVATYDLERKQKLVFRFYSGGGTQDTGSYSIKISGSGLYFGDDISLIATEPSDSATRKDRLPCVPRNGILRLAMQDGTFHEVNLAQVKEMSLRP